ncbi:MAG: HAD-IB family hydrolase [Pseudomonadota bacterium]|nr:HAD-IB family hydrolase [Pseudomonadota bacterium]
MESGTPPRQSDGAFRPLVAFDFDGTLTWKDSFLAFLAWRAGPLGHALGMIRMAPAALAYGLDRDRTALKRAMVTEYLKGARREDLEGEAQAFAADSSRRLLRPDAVRCWRLWQTRGARLIIVTASPEFVVAPFARGLAAEMLIGTKLAWDADGRVAGAFDGPNCRGPEKVVRLKAAFDAGVRLEAAYGDSVGDTEMLALADEAGMKVFRDKP